MCLPLVAVAAIGAGVMSAAGSVVQGMSANSQGKYEAGVAKQNAVLEREAAAQSIRQGQTERRDYWRKVGSVKGQQIAAMAANGIDVDYGTAGRVQDDTQMLANEDAANLYENIHNRTRGFIINASNYKMAAKAVKQQGKAALVGSLFQGAGSLLSSFSQASAMKAKMGTSSAYGGG
jgi:hypothetical protein